MIARALCRFELYQPPAQLSAGDALKAARLRLSTGAPFIRAGGQLVRKGRLFGLWWWDQDVVERALGGTVEGVKLLPEVFVTQPGEGFRIVRTLSGGLEAQLWREGFLLASSFQKGSWSHQDWDTFVRTASSDPEAVDIPPVAPALRSWTNSYRRARLRTEPLSALLTNVGLVTAALCLALTGFFAGQAMRLNGLADQLEAQLAATPEPTPATADVEARRRLAEISQFAQAAQASDPLLLLAEAAAVLEAADARVTTFSAGEGRIEIGTPASTLEQAERIARGLEMSPSFINVSARLEETGARDLVFEMDVEPSSPVSPDSRSQSEPASPAPPPDEM